MVDSSHPTFDVTLILSFGDLRQTIPSKLGLTSKQLIPLSLLLDEHDEPIPMPYEDMYIVALTKDQQLIRDSKCSSGVLVNFNLKNYYQLMQIIGFTRDMMEEDVEIQGSMVILSKDNVNEIFKSISTRFNEAIDQIESQGQFCYGQEEDMDFEMERDIEIQDNTGQQVDDNQFEDAQE